MAICVPLSAPLDTLRPLEGNPFHETNSFQSNESFRLIREKQIPEIYE